MRTWDSSAIRLGGKLFYIEGGRVFKKDSRRSPPRQMDVSNVVELFKYKEQVGALQNAVYVSRGVRYTVVLLWDENKSSWIRIGTAINANFVNVTDNALIVLSGKSMEDWVFHPLSRFAHVYADFPGQWRRIDERGVQTVKRVVRGDHNDALVTFADGGEAYVSELASKP